MKSQTNRAGLINVSFLFLVSLSACGSGVGGLSQTHSSLDEQKGQPSQVGQPPISSDAALNPTLNKEVDYEEVTKDTRDEHRYPYKNAAYSGNIIGSTKARAFEYFVVSLQIGVDPSFDEKQQVLIKDAVQLFSERALKTEVVDCAYRNSNRDFPTSRTEFEAMVYNAISPININGVFLPGFLFVARFWHDPVAVGIGYINLFFDRDDPLPGYQTRHYLHIGLNSEFMGDESQYYLKNDAAYWAGVIGHEILHNLGMSHPNGYPGSFVKEYGNCIWSESYSATTESDESSDIEVSR